MVLNCGSICCENWTPMLSPLAYADFSFWFIPSINPLMNSLSLGALILFTESIFAAISFCKAAFCVESAEAIRD